VFQQGEVADGIYMVKNGDFKIMQLEEEELPERQRVPRDPFIKRDPSKVKSSKNISISVINKGQIFGLHELIRKEKTRKFSV